MTADTYLKLSWGTSRGAETYGWNICRLRDETTGQTFRCMGGGYDMTGTVLAEWAMATHYDRLIQLASRAHYVDTADSVGYQTSGVPDALYGMTRHETDGRRTAAIRVTLDGGCGVESIRRILDAAGISTRGTVTARGNTSGFLVTVTDGAS